MKLLVSPLAKGAYFADYLEVATTELAAIAPELETRLERIGPFDFLDVPADEALGPDLVKASVVQGAFTAHEDQLRALDIVADFALPSDFVFGSKYQGKTNELVTQLAINAALRYCDRPARTLFDPMAGQGTTLLWAIRYGLSARGIELDPNCLDALHRHIKKQTKLHRIKHRHAAGFTGARNRQGWGKFVRYEFGDQYLQLIAGDSAETAALTGGQRFDILVADLPYGIQFKGKGPRSDILATVTDCAKAWVASVRPGGCIALIFNRYQPNRESLIELFVGKSCRVEPFEVPHRMSESIVRDVVVFTRDSGPRGLG